MATPKANNRPIQ